MYNITVYLIIALIHSNTFLVRGNMWWSDLAVSLILGISGQRMAINAQVSATQAGKAIQNTVY
jgi:hypothetical protein